MHVSADHVSSLFSHALRLALAASSALKLAARPGEQKTRLRAPCSVHMFVAQQCAHVTEMPNNVRMLLKIKLREDIGHVHDVSQVCLLR